MPKHLQHADQAAALLYHARSATPFCSPGGEPCASIPTSVDARHVLPLRSAAFRDWIIANYYAEYESAPSPVALRAALRTLEARAQYGDTTNSSHEESLTIIALDSAEPYKFTALMCCSG